MNIVNVINLDRRTDRLYSICRQSKWQGFAIQFWEGIEETPVHKGVCMAHKRIVRDAKERRLDRVIIAEDDLIMSAGGSWDYYIQQMPPVFDLYMGMIYTGEVVNNRIVSSFSGTTLYTVGENFYDKFLEVPDESHIDRALGRDCHKNNYIVPDQYVCYQSGGYSDNGKVTYYYDEMMRNKKFYGREIIP
jgi:hypothetical protein